FPNESVEWFILVKGSKDVVAVGPDRAGVVEVQPMRVGIARVVEPVTPAVFSVLRGGQELVDVSFVGGIGRIRGKGVRLGRLGEQPGKFETDPPDQPTGILGAV